ncbi:methyltransferase [Nocardioides fonticola]|uniref:Methyltransferase n=1 Tax=Nocardioides fonticola TaxID=450363 RepID=A0ABP7XAP4_9ACTN
MPGPAPGPASGPASGSERPSDRRGAVRTGVVWAALQPLVTTAPLDVVDIGGGTGGLAVRIAALGHRVTVIDPSPDALAALDRRARDAGVAVAGEQGDLASLADRTASADLVLCHGVLEVAGDPAQALAVLAGSLRAGGALSLLVAQRHAAVIARAMAGHFGQALALLDSTAPTGRAGVRFTAAELEELVAGAGLDAIALQGVRVFADLVPGSLLDLEPGATAALLELEHAVATRPEYRPLAAQLHLLARRRGR